jgi:hypothetical protein
MTRKTFGIGSEIPRIWRYGKDLLREDQGVCLMVWEEKRYTVKTMPEWAETELKLGKDCPPQFASDMDWLRHTKFAVTMSGRLDRRVRECREEPTWPTRPELRTLSKAKQAMHAPNIRYRGWTEERAEEMRLQEAEQDEAPDPLTAAMSHRDKLLALGLDPSMDDEND